MPGVLVQRGLSLLSLGSAGVKSLIVGTPIPGAKKAPGDAGALGSPEEQIKLPSGQGESPALPHLAGAAQISTAATARILKSFRVAAQA